MMVVDNKFEIEQFVYLKTDTEQLRRIVLSFEVYKGGEVMYRLGVGQETSTHYEFEISAEQDITVKQ